MGLYDTIMADTVGVAWSAVSGTVDPWTKDQLEQDETASLVQTGADPTVAAAQASTDISATLKNAFAGTSTPSADPTDFTAGVSATFSKVTSFATAALQDTKTLLIIIAIAAVAVLLLLGKAKKTVGVGV